ncbi:MAG TPA: hypothetical protein PLG77_06400, partial [Burkholderiaceae bacterium]|nr:hypothetical protein [Burkholderiaceae bacterium]
MARAGRRHTRRAQFALKSVPAVVALACAGMQAPARAIEVADIDFLAPDAALNRIVAQRREVAASALQARLSLAVALAASKQTPFRAPLRGFGAGPIRAADAVALTWFGGTGDWMVGANWLPAGGPPGADDTATINAGNAQLAVATTIAGLQMNGGQVSGAGALTVSGASQWTGGAHSGTGTSQFDGSLSIT